MDNADTTPDPDVILDGRYRLQGIVGTGGMGRVYRAEHVGLGRPVAIKVLDPKLLSDDTARRRFEREAQATSRLRHANCVGVTDFGAMPDGSPYLVMDLVEGITLEDLLDAENRLPLPRAVHIMRHLLRGLGHAHSQGLVHRDLKPANIMLTTDGADRDVVRILDFGLARMVDGGSDRVTRTGIVCGTPRYMSPEQALDRPLDARTDLYAASILLFEMLAGRTPFESDETLGLLKLHLSAPVPRIAEVTPGVVVPQELEELIRRGLGKTPDERPASADDYLAALERAYAANATIELSGSLASLRSPHRRRCRAPALSGGRGRADDTSRSAARRWAPCCWSASSRPSAEATRRPGRRVR